MIYDDLQAILNAAHDADERGNAVSAATLRTVAQHVGQMELLLKHLRRNSGECIADHPQWLEQIDRLLGPSSTNS